MMIKVCGVTNEVQAGTISEFTDFIGFIFYPKSKRSTPHSFPSMSAKKTGVFVNTPINEIVRMAILEKLEVVQLHGDESPEICAALQSQIPVIKSFGVDANFDFKETIVYESCVDYFLFDTKTSNYGGSGVSFDWNLLDRYEGKTPFFLSGGIHTELLDEIKKIKHPKLVGIDLNSGFELNPGIKNIELLKHFVHEFKS